MGPGAARRAGSAEPAAEHCRNVSEGLWSSLLKRANACSGKTQPWGHGLGPNLSSALSRRASELSVYLSVSVRLSAGVSPVPHRPLATDQLSPLLWGGGDEGGGGVPLRGELRLAKARYSPLAERMMGYRRGAGVTQLRGSQQEERVFAQTFERNQRRRSSLAAQDSSALRSDA